MKKKYTKKQITEAIKYWEKQLNEAESTDQMKIIQALIVGKLNADSFNASGIWNNDGIYWHYPEDNVDYVIQISNIVKTSQSTYTCDVYCGINRKPLQLVGKQDFTINNIPIEYNFDTIIDNIESYDVLLGSMNGFSNAFDAHSDYVREYDLAESNNKYMKKQYTKKQITEAIAYWEKILAESYPAPRFSDTFQTPIHPSDFKYSIATTANGYDTQLKQFLHSNTGFLSQHMNRFLYLAGLGKFYGKEFTPIEDMIKHACAEYTDYAMKEEDGCLPFDKTSYYKDLINKLLVFLTKKISMLKANGDRCYIFKNPQEAAEKAVNDVIIPVIAVYLSV